MEQSIVKILRIEVRIVSVLAVDGLEPVFPPSKGFDDDGLSVTLGFHDTLKRGKPAGYGSTKINVQRGRKVQLISISLGCKEVEVSDVSTLRFVAGEGYNNFSCFACWTSAPGPKDRK